MDPKCNNPLLMLGNCENFLSSWRKMQNRIPPGTKGNAYPDLRPPPYGVTPLCTPKIPYEPLTMSLARGVWEGWRYGSNYVNTDGQERPYGFPDYHYYRKNYCGPCCPCVDGTTPPLLGDPQGKNPNIRYIQLDSRNLLGSGFAAQGTPPTKEGVSYGFTSCGKDHCSECSGVYKKKEQPVKFQVCIGDPKQPETVQPCPAQQMRIYLPLQVVPKPELCQIVKKCPEVGEKECQEMPPVMEQKKQLYEVYVPGQECAYNQLPRPKCRIAQMPKGPDPCANRDLCKNRKKVNMRNQVNSIPC